MSQRMLGEFRCPKCNTTWTSANAYPGYGQMCAKCKIERPLVMPHKMVHLNKTDDKKKKKEESGKEHSMELCQKCKTLGRPCWK